MLFRSVGRPRQFNILEKFRALVVPDGVYRKELIIQGIMACMVVLPNGQSCLKIKGYVTGVSLHAPIQSNSP